ncbi:hemK methyltransferase family member 1 isoform X2 [Numida meleagris]|uniref:hemK methyltransferase family member 1 isoform X2 n=1 Tax=Numida meleagris TaxID=8996 RepID=UPI000B3DDE50|nr:hemK methyltransferase family member 1 isoform X2 [Numida meleagris]
MRCLTPSLLRRFWGLLPQYVPAGPSPSPVIGPKQSSLRQSCSTRPGPVTAPAVARYWQEVFEKNGIPEARESSEYIVSFVLGAKTFQSLDSEKLHTPITAMQQEQIQQLCCKRLERMPVQYVLGEWDFQDLTLKMRPPVFIPRPETEKHQISHLLVSADSMRLFCFWTSTQLCSRCCAVRICCILLSASVLKAAWPCAVCWLELCSCGACGLGAGRRRPHASLCSCGSKKYSELETWPQGRGDANQPDMKGDRLTATTIFRRTPHLCTDHLFHCTPCLVIYPKKGLHPYVQAELTLAPGESHCCAKKKLTLILSGCVAFR